MTTNEQKSRTPGMETMKPQDNTTVSNAAVYDSADLFKGTTEIGIEHGGAVYRLKITRQGKLILNK